MLGQSTPAMIDCAPPGRQLAWTEQRGIQHDRDRRHPDRELQGRRACQVRARFRLAGAGEPRADLLLDHRLRAGWPLRPPRGLRLHHPGHVGLHVDHRRLDLVYTADLDISDSSLLQLQLESPDGFQLQAASLEQQEVQVPLRAAPSDGDGTVLFLDRPVLGQQRLVVRGVLAITGKQIPVPLIRLRGARIDSGRVRVFATTGSR